ncbi:MAG: ATP-dependent 6-phosphofructokinase [Actinomycetales bacterium]|nr:ATP-dependent 6-phosphofructokinase [Actinomycetales bacterium]
MTIVSADLDVRTLGECRIDSPLAGGLGARRTSQHYVAESDRVLFDDTTTMVVERGVPAADLPGFEPAGPRRRIFFDPSKIRAGIVTCGGLCPGLNDVVRGIVLQLTQLYGVRRIVGFRNGYRGFIPRYGDPTVELTPASVNGIDELGGTVLGTSRGQQDVGEIVDCLERMDVNILFVVGGDGSMRGAIRIAQEVRARGCRIAVVGIPKTIDNDIPFIDHSFGFQTAFAEAARFLRAAQVEASSVPNGVGLVKLMGRHSGFIACYARLAEGDTDFVLIPEVPFALDGEHGFLAHLGARVREKGFAVVAVAEGAGQEHLTGGQEAVDASGNRKLKDIGSLLRDRIVEDLTAAGVEPVIKYFDPSYAIRSVPANSFDSVYCIQLAQAAVHAAMAGRTETVIGRWHGRYVHIPMALVVSERSQVDPNGELWLSVLEATGQPARFGAAPEDAATSLLSV